MLTALTGEVRPHSAQLRLPAFPVPSDNNFQFPESDLSYITTANGVLITYQGILVAWIYPGHAGSRNSTKPCSFFDVACPSLTFDPQQRITGVVLDNLSFDTLPEAVHHVETTFASQGGTA